MRQAGGGAVRALLLGALPADRLGRWLKGDYVIPGKPDEDRTGPGGPGPADAEDTE
jgi:hypothetical protein